MATIRNVLFIMVDQVRWDHVGAYGVSPVLTPHIDVLARRGPLFQNAFVQRPVCGPSRMSYYTGRYVMSHGARWNRVPLSTAEKTLGDYLRPLGVKATLAGKSHVSARHRDAGPDGHRDRVRARCTAARRWLLADRAIRRPQPAGPSQRLRGLPARGRLRRSRPYQLRRVVLPPRTSASNRDSRWARSFLRSTHPGPASPSH